MAPHIIVHAAMSGLAFLSGGLKWQCNRWTRTRSLGLRNQWMQVELDGQKPVDATKVELDGRSGMHNPQE